MAISLTVPPVTTTFVPVSAIDLMISSILTSSDLLYPLRSSALFMRTVPFASVPDASIPHPKTVILASDTEVIVVSTLRSVTNPCMTSDWSILPPRILVTRTVSGLTLNFPVESDLDAVARQAFAISGARTTSEPNCFAAKTGLIASAKTNSETSFTSTVLFTSVGKILSRYPPAFLNPAMTSLVCNPLLSSSSVALSNPPAKLTVRLVPSPHSSSCILAARLSILAAGCSISSSFTIVAQSLVTVMRSKWLTTSLFMPLGPSEVWTMRESSFEAEMLRRVAASRPSREVWPSLSMPERPAAEFRAMDVMMGY
mmetsp:Transcript_22634/g.27757  ORF Transcript_22634/g.27757 Transcript_22634/m.27757 type:complete len:313 (-) Transcript_22634:121-1059(-)